MTKLSSRELHYFHPDKHLNMDDVLHAEIIAGGDEQAAREVSDKVAKDIGLTDEQIAALHEPEPRQRIKDWLRVKREAQATLARLPKDEA